MVYDPCRPLYSHNNVKLQHTLECYDRVIERMSQWFGWISGEVTYAKDSWLTKYIKSKILKRRKNMTMLERIISDSSLETVFQRAYEIAGFRERFAMEHGSRRTYWSNGRKFIKFTYSKSVPYQDANGATYCVSTNNWVG